MGFLHELRIVPREVTSLKAYKGNARTHSKKQIRQIADSLKRFGWTNPILIDENGNILAGHGRLEAAKLLGTSEVPTISIGGLSPSERRAYIITDNRIAENAGWDKELLAIEFGALIGETFDIELTGFDTIEIDNILGREFGQDDTEEDLEFPDPTAVAVSRPGDLWTGAGHGILCGDARDPDSYERLLGRERGELVFTDPPFNVRGNAISGNGKIVHGDFVMGSGELSPAMFTHDLLRPAFRRIADFSLPGAIGFVCLDWRHLREFTDAAQGVFAELKNLIVWSKTNAGMGTFYRSQHELILAFKISPGEHINNFGLGEGGRHRSNVWIYPGANAFRKGRLDDLAGHPTVKPLKLVFDAILDCSKPNGIVLDPFLGSGTTVVAAARAGRRGCGIELDPVYVDLCIRRLEQQTGGPMQLETGETFAQVRERRLTKREG